MFKLTDNDHFHSLVVDAKLSHKYGACVDAYSPQDYHLMECFATEDGTAGFAIKRGDIVSAFSTAGSTATAGDILFAAIREGGWRLDCFDTVLPDLYREAGFVEVSRCRFDDDYAPAGWDFDTYRRFNDGRPDVVFMVHESRTFGEVPVMVCEDYETASDWADSYR